MRSNSPSVVHVTLSLTVSFSRPACAWIHQRLAGAIGSQYSRPFLHSDEYVQYLIRSSDVGYVRRFWQVRVPCAGFQNSNTTANKNLGKVRDMLLSTRCYCVKADTRPVHLVRITGALLQSEPRLHPVKRKTKANKL